MAKKKMGQMDWLGVNQGGMGYFIKYCPKCGEKIYLTENELKEFLAETYTPRLWALVRNWLKLRVQVPKVKLSVEWRNPREAEIVKLNERITLSQNKILKKKDPKKFSRSFFEKKYSARGGMGKLERMINNKSSLSEIGEWFGFSKQRACDILQSYRAQKFCD